MSQNTKVMIVEDNQQLAESIRSFFIRKNMIEITGVAFDSFEAIEMLKVSRPDVIILDLVMPRSDGFVLLEYLRGLKSENRPEAFILSSLSHDAIIKRACDLGAIYYMVKPFSMVDLHERVLNIAGLKTNQRERYTDPPKGLGLIDQYLSTLLSDFGIPIQNRGYRYICEAVKQVVAKPELMDSITKQLYPQVGKKFNASPITVERAIRRAIEVAWDSERLQAIENSASDNPPPLQYRPSNGEFISLLSSRVWECILNQTKAPSKGEICG